MALLAPGATYRMEWYPGNEAAAEILCFATRPIAPALALFRATRQYFSSLIEQRLDKGEHHFIFHTPAPYPTQTLTVKQTIETLIRHVEEHTEEIAAIRRRHEQ